MTLIISGDIRLAQGYTRPDDADAVAYIAAVEAADGQPLETEVRMAINAFVKGCKADGIWDAIKASCILAGARTLDGALVPLAGTAPTNFNFVSGNYNRKTGLKGNGSTKYLDSNRNNNADPQDSFHLSVFRGEQLASGSASTFIGVGTAGASGRSSLVNNYLTGFTNGYFFRARSNSDGGVVATGSQDAAGFVATSRASSSTASYRAPGGQSGSISTTSETPLNSSLFVFATNNAGSSASLSNSRLAFYSIGEALDLALLDARVTDLINKFAEVIP